DRPLEALLELRYERAADRLTPDAIEDVVDGGVRSIRVLPDRVARRPTQHAIGQHRDAGRQLRQDGELFDLVHRRGRPRCREQRDVVALLVEASTVTGHRRIGEARERADIGRAGAVGIVRVDQTVTVVVAGAQRRTGFDRLADLVDLAVL